LELGKRCERPVPARDRRDAATARCKWITAFGLARSNGSSLTSLLSSPPPLTSSSGAAAGAAEALGADPLTGGLTLTSGRTAEEEEEEAAVDVLAAEEEEEVVTGRGLVQSSRTRAAHGCSKFNTTNRQSTVHGSQI